MKPLKNYALVIEAKKEDTTAGGLILTSASTDGKPGSIVAVGPKCEEVAVGDKIELAWDKGLRTTYDGQKAVLISEDFIVAVH
jgi:co-chaperonin GroES (HSP10)